MARYYFPCRVGDCLASDAEGVELLSDVDARFEALRVLVELARDEGGLEGNVELDVRAVDAAGRAFFTASLSGRTPRLPN